VVVHSALSAHVNFTMHVHVLPYFHIKLASQPDCTGVAVMLPVVVGCGLILSGLKLGKRPHHLPDGWQWEHYHRHDEVVSFLTFMGKTYGHVAALHSIGKRYGAVGTKAHA